MLAMESRSLQRVEKLIASVGIGVESFATFWEWSRTEQRSWQAPKVFTVQVRDLALCFGLGAG
jgi:hypothetical protein